MRTPLIAAVAALALLAPAGAAADTKTFGTGLDRPADNTRTCETGFYDPALIAGTGFPYTPYASCTWWSVGGFDGKGSSIVPYGGGTVKRVRVKVGAVTGRMQVVALRLMRHPGSLADPACCFPSSASPVFTPDANGVTEIEVDMPVKHETDKATGIVNYDVLALSVLDDGVPMPADATADGGWGGVVAGMFPAYEPGTERSVGYGTVVPGHVLLEADLEPAAGGEPVRAGYPPVNPTVSLPPAPPAGPVVPGPVVDTAVPPAALPAGRAVVRGGTVGMPVTCSTPGGCKGEIVLTSAPARGAAKRRPRPVVLARGRVALAAGVTKTVRAPLSKQGRRALRRSRRVTALATLRIGGKPVAGRTVTLARG